MTASPFLLASLSLFLPATFLAAEGPVPEVAEVEAALSEWRAEHGYSWRAHGDPRGGYVEMLYGGGVEAEALPRTEADWFQLARERVEEARALLGVDPSTLFEREVAHLPLAHIGTTDKVTVRFQQELAGVAVEEGTVNVLFDSEGRLLSLHATALTGTPELDPRPLLEREEATRLARLAFEESEGLPGALIGAPRLVVDQVASGDARRPRLAWRLDLRWEEEGFLPVGETFWIDAGNGAVLRHRPNIHQWDVSGTVSAMATPGTAPDVSSNPEVSQLMRHLKLTSAAGDTATTDSSGSFVFPGVSSPLQVTAKFVGSFANVNHMSGTDYVLNTTLPSDSGNSILLNPTSSTLVTAEANAFHSISLLRDWVRSVSPNDPHADFQAIANVNIYSSCNAYYNGSSVNFYRASASCVNTSYSTVVAHEMGHWLNDRYGTGNGLDGMGEGNADVFAMYLYDTPLVGEGFFGGSSVIRDGNNTLQFCGDCCPGCNGGEVHQEGKVWMGAAWKVRDRLNVTLGNALGDATADAIFLAWMRSYNQTQIKSIIEAQWVVMDDDDADINNGSPHFAEIEWGFLAQGWPGVQLHELTIEDVVPVPDSLTESGPYELSARLVPHFGQTVNLANLHCRVNGGSYAQMNLTPLPDHGYLALLPDVASPAFVEYYLESGDTLGNTVFWPEGGASAPATFSVGNPTTFYLETFESGDNGWTHASYGDTSNSSDEWQRGLPAGDSGFVSDGTVFGVSWADPGQAVSGVNVWAVDLGNGTNGTYGPNIHTWLRSPAIDCSASTGVQLRFQRWLSVHSADEATLRVNGTPVWTSGDAQHVNDWQWNTILLEIGALADGNPVVQLEWELWADGQYNLGGWQIDDVELLHLGPGVDPCPAPRNYGPGKISGLGDETVMGYGGSPTIGGNFMVKVEYAGISQPAFLFSGGSWALQPFLGGYRLVAHPISREGHTTTTAYGSAWFPIQVDGGLVGTTRYYQVWCREPTQPDGTGVGLSDGLRVDYCP